MAAVSEDKELQDIKKERDVAIAEREDLKLKIKEKNRQELQAARAQLKQCNDELQVVLGDKKKADEIVRSHWRRCREAEREIEMVVDHAEEEKSHAIATLSGEKIEKVKSLQRDIQQWKIKYESTKASCDAESETYYKDIEVLEAKLNDVQQLIENKRQMASKRECDLTVQASELEGTIKEQKARLEELMKTHE